MSQRHQPYAHVKRLACIEYSVRVFQGKRGVVQNEHILHFRLLDPRMVGSSIMFTKYVSEWASDLQAISLNVGVTTFGPPCIYIYN